MITQVALAVIVLPWLTFSSMTPDVQGAGLAGMCAVPGGTEEVYKLKASHQGNDYLFFFAPTTGRLIVGYYPGQSEMPSHLGVGTVDMRTEGAQDTIPSLTWTPFDLAAAPDICATLFPQQT